MDEFSRELIAALDATTREIGHFFDGFSKDITELMDGVFLASEEIADRVQNTLTTEIEPQLIEWLDQLLEAYLGFEDTLEQTIQPIAHTVEPLINNHPACVGCRNYHGQEYGGNLLVCGMHPYGWEGETCPDWESTWKPSRNHH